MNKKRVDQWVGTARNALTHCGIAENGKIDKNFRSQISAFGAAVIMGSFKAAVAFYSKQGNADTDRSALLKAIYYVINGEEAYNSQIKNNEKSAELIFDSVCAADDLDALQAAYLDASIALKLAMNFFDMGQDDTTKPADN